MADNDKETYPKRRRKTLRWVVTLVIVLAGSASLYWWHQLQDPPHYVTADVTRGSIVRSVTATGTVNPVVTVQVGSYVSGTIIRIDVDFNSPVKAGQLLAKIDPRPFAAQVALAQAALANSRAQLRKDQANLAYQRLTYVRDGDLIKTDVISQDQLDSQKNTMDQAFAQVGLDEATIQQQQASLKSAELNLNYTDIVSPVDGTVVSRNVDVGQTVAASYQTPTLFLVAKDLTKMQVDTNVSESDIGAVKEGQPAVFRVDAFPERDFDGVVGPVRQAPITVQNVVTYDVVVNVSNPELMLKPGMTANVTIVTDRRDDVLRIPVAALTFASRRHARTVKTGERPGHVPHLRVYTLNGDGQLHPVRIARGMDDGNFVEVLSGDLKPGDQVVVDEQRAGRGGKGNIAMGMGGPGGHLPHL
jgi:HlyD family secretion protein